MNKRKNIVYIMSGSISNWFSYFCDSENLIEVIFGNSEMKEDILKEIERVENTYGKTVNIYIISSHISLKSDIDLVRRFRERGYKVFAQTETAIRYGINKIDQKKMFEKENFRTPEWILPICDEKSNYLVKMNNATEGAGIAWYDSVEKRDVYYEKYVSGMEFSINIFSNEKNQLLSQQCTKDETVKI